MENNLGLFLLKLLIVTSLNEQNKKAHKGFWQSRWKF